MLPSISLQWEEAGWGVICYLPYPHYKKRQGKYDEYEEDEEDGVEGDQLPHLPPRGVDGAASGSSRVDILW